ncbi:MAG: hypothetical protein HDR50_06680 [Desulfovibrio sp.]|nr:hypothetical protein [Desulfovibrio sp.]MBD5417333.1 hypothetical protein [Desulfovibrio sp.]
MDEKIENLKKLKEFFVIEWNVTEDKAKLLALRCIFGCDLSVNSDWFQPF